MRRKTMKAVEWGKQLFPLSYFIPPRKILGSSQPFAPKREWQHESGDTSQKYL
jgi:hypothetical protein